jgi:hypothetical protein
MLTGATVPGQSSACSTSLGLAVRDELMEWSCAIGISLLGATAITFSTTPLSTAYRPVLLFAASLTQATGIAERKVAEEMNVRYSPGARRITLDAAEGYAAFVADLRAFNLTPHIAQNGRRSVIDARTTRYPRHAVSQQKRKLEELLGFAQPMLRGAKKRGFKFTLTMARYSLIRLPTLIGAAA